MSIKYSLNNNQHLKIFGLLNVALVSGLFITGCDNPSTKDVQDTTEEKEVVVSKPSLPNAAEFCTQDKLESVVQQYAEAKITEQAEANAKERSASSGLVFDASNASAKVADLSVAVSDIKPTTVQKGEKTVSCQAQIQINIPQAEIDKANARYAYKTQETLANQVAGSDITLNGEKLSENVKFTIDVQTAVPVITTVAGMKVVSMVSDVLAASATQDRKNIVVAAARKRAAEKRRAEKARRAEQARKRAAAEKRRAEQARKQKPQSNNQSASSTRKNSSYSSLSKGSNTSIEAKPKVSDNQKHELKVPDAQNVQLEITQGTDTY